MDRISSRHWRALAGAVGCLALAHFSYGFLGGDAGRVPLLGHVDLGFHELGHLITYPLPWEVVTAAMGSVMQVAVPLGLAAYFLVLRRDLVAAALCLAWAGTSARDAGVYIADAPHEALPLIGGSHDWAFILERHLDWAEPLADAVSTGGAAAIAAGVALAVSSLWLPRPPAPAPSVEHLTAPIRVIT